MTTAASSPAQLTPSQQINSSSAPASVPAPVPAPAASSAHGSSRLSFDDVAKHFNVPIAEAATALGVCSSVLKRICRENGVIRWPYRKFLAGKTVDEIKREAAREKGKEFAELSRVARERQDQAANAHSVITYQATTLVAGHVPDASKLQKGFSFTEHPTQQQGTKVFSDGHGVFQPLHNIPNYVDEFKHGFPVDGLSTATPQWRGGISGESTGRSTQTGLPLGQEKADREESTLSAPEEGMEPENGSTPVSSVSLLCLTRKRAAIEAEESVRLGVSRGHGQYMLGKRHGSILTQVFGSSLSCQWK